jgi:hypothetical protein
MHPISCFKKPYRLKRLRACQAAALAEETRLARSQRLAAIYPYRYSKEDGGGGVWGINNS